MAEERLLSASSLDQPWGRSPSSLQALSSLCPQPASSLALLCREVLAEPRDFLAWAVSPKSLPTQMKQIEWGGGGEWNGNSDRLYFLGL